MSEQNKPMPCPFHDAIEISLYEPYVVEANPVFFYVRCRYCRARGPTRGTKELAVSNWDAMARATEVER